MNVESIYNRRLILQRMLTVCVSAMWCVVVHAQSTVPAGDILGPPRPPDVAAIRFTGSINASTDYYGAGGISPRQPWGISRVICFPTVTLYDQIQIPFEIYLSTSSSGYQQSFNQVGVNPRIWDWITLHGGYFSMRISDLTFGDLRVLGGGMELTPGKWRFSALYGGTRDARGPDTSIGSYGIYQRTVWSGKISYGVEAKTIVSLNIVHAIDDAATIVAESIGALADSTTKSNPDTLRAWIDKRQPPPKENMAVSLSFGSVIVAPVRIYGEVGLSAFSNDTRLNPIPNQGFLPRSIFTVRGSTQVDGAAKLGVIFTPEPAWSVRINSQWIGPGYTTLGYSQLANDVLETTIAPNVRLFHNTLLLNGSLGYRSNNLRNNRTSTTNRIIGSIGGDATINEHIGFNVQYSNYGMRAVNNTISNVFQYVSVGPRFTFLGLGGINSLIASYSFQDASIVTISRITPAVKPGDSTSPPPVPYDLTTGVYTKTHMAMMVHTLFLPSTMSLGTTAFVNYLESNVIVRIVNITETVGKRYFDNKLSTSVSLGYGIVTTTVVDGQIIGRLAATYQMERYGSLSFSLSNNNYQYGSSIPSFNEIQASLQYSLFL